MEKTEPVTCTCGRPHYPPAEFRDAVCERCRHLHLEHVLALLDERASREMTFEAFAEAFESGAIPPAEPKPKRPTYYAAPAYRPVPASPSQAWREGFSYEDWAIVHGDRRAA